MQTPLAFLKMYLSRCITEGFDKVFQLSKRVMYSSLHLHISSCSNPLLDKLFYTILQTFNAENGTRHQCVFKDERLHFSQD